MPGRISPRRVCIHGHQTSLRLEPQFWHWLREIAAECGCTAKTLIEGIVVAKSPQQNLSSALRTYIWPTFTARTRTMRWLIPQAGPLCGSSRRARSTSTETAVAVRPDVR